MEIYKRNHFFVIINSIFSGFIQIAIPIFLLAIGTLGSDKAVFFNVRIRVVILIIILIAITIHSVLKWMKNVYCIRDNFIVVREGIFIIKRREIPFNKIQTINVSQGIKERIFKIASLKIDTGNSNNNKAEVSIVIAKKEAEKLRMDILRSKQTDIMDETTEVKTTYKNTRGLKQYEITKGELLRAGVTSNAVFAGIAFIGSIYTFLDDYLESFIDKSIEGVDGYIGNLDFNKMSTSDIILIVLISMFVFIAFSFLLSIIGTYVKYYGFTVKRETENIIINYGLLEKKSYTLPISKIKAVYIRQNFLRQIFGLSALYVESIGYGNEKGEEAMLFPIADGVSRKDIIKKMLPEFVFKNELVRVPKRALPSFVIFSSLIPLIICIVLSIVFKYGFISFMTLPVFILGGFLGYKNAAVASDGKRLCISTQAFTRNIAVVAIRDIQSMAEGSNCFQRRKGLSNYEIVIQSNSFGKTIKVKNLDKDFKNELMNGALKDVFI